MRRTLAFVGVIALISAAPAHADVRLTIQNGLVSLSATNATLRQILDEWARVGQTRIVNAERIVGAPLSLELTNVPEERALEVILRSLSGYVVAPRPTQNPAASKFDRIVVMATSTPVRSAAPSAAPAVFVPPRDDQEEQPEEDQNAVQPSNLAAPGPRPPAFAPPSSPMPPSPQVPPAAVVTPPTYGIPGSFLPPQPAGQIPIGVATPGMVVPAPQPASNSPGDNQAPQ
jgi:hypothetical protein